MDVSDMSDDEPSVANQTPETVNDEHSPAEESDEGRQSPTSHAPISGLSESTLRSPPDEQGSQSGKVTAVVPKKVSSTASLDVPLSSQLVQTKGSNASTTSLMTSIPGSVVRERKGSRASSSSRERRPSPGGRNSLRHSSPHRRSPIPGKKSSSPALGRHTSGKFLDVPKNAGGSSRSGGSLPSLFLRTQTQDIQVNELGQSFHGRATQGRGIDLFEMESEVDETIAPSAFPTGVGIAIMDWRLDGDATSELLNLQINVSDEKTYRKLIQTLASFQ